MGDSGGWSDRRLASRVGSERVSRMSSVIRKSSAGGAAWDD